MQGYPRRRLPETVILAMVLSCLSACAGQTDSPGRQPEDDYVTTTFIDARPAALVDGKVVEWGEMRPLLNEAAGAAILQEIVLDRMLIVELGQKGMAVTDQDVERERDLFYETLSPDPDVAARLARELRSRQGLGPLRMERLLRRNARLRALVADDVVISEAALVLTCEIMHGPTRRARLMVLPTLAEAQSAIDRVEAGEFFGDVAVEISTDSSAARGGLLAPVNRADPTYPQVMRDALWALQPGEISPPILLDRQYAVLMMVEEIDGDGVTLEADREAVEKQVRLEQERLLMDQKARQLLTESSVTIIDSALKSSWDQRVRSGSSRP